MGIRFRCHHCEHELHVKDFLAGKRGKCPNCEGKFRIPNEDAPYSLQVDKRAATASEFEANADPQEVFSPNAESEPEAEKPANRATTTQQSEDGQPPAAQPEASPASGGTPNSAVKIQTHEDRPAVAEGQAPAQDTRGGKTDRNSTTVLDKPVPAAIAEAAEAAWYVRISDGSQFGPANGEIFVQWLGENRIQPESLVWRDGWEQWKLAAEAFSDYFHESPPGSSPSGLSGSSSPPAMSPSTLPADSPPSSTMSVTGGAVQSVTALGENRRLEKRRRRQRNYRLTITFLSVAALLLIVSLIIVLFVQQQ